MTRICHEIASAVSILFLLAFFFLVPVFAASPDWRARYGELKEQAVTSFTGAEIGDRVTLTLTIGGDHTGTLAGLSTDKVILSVAGRHQTFEKPKLTPDSRKRLFAEDYAHSVAMEQVQKERKEWETEQTRLRQEQAKLEAERDRQEAMRRQDERKQLLAEMPDGIREFMQEWKRTGKRPEWPRHHPKVGLTGLLGKVYDIQIVGEDDMLARLSYYYRARPDAYEIGQARVWVHGISTAGLVDGAHVRLDKVMTISGTRKYTTVLGAGKTVFFLEPVDVSPYMKFLNQ